MNGYQVLTDSLSRVLMAWVLLLLCWTIPAVGQGGQTVITQLVDPRINASKALANAPQPEIVSISPTAGPLDGGTLVTVFGSGFQVPMQVKFGALTALDVNVFNDTTPADNDRITCITPDYSFEPNVPPVVVDVTATNTTSGKSSTLSGAFTFGDPLFITGNTPSDGQPGDLVIIYGSGFEDPLQVFFPSGSGQQMNVVSVSGTELVVQVPPDFPPPCGSMGGAFKVVLLETSKDTIGGDFTLLGSRPIVTSVSPAILEETIAEGGPISPDAITVTGQNFANEVRVQLGAYFVPSENTTVVDQSTIEVKHIQDAFPLGVNFDTADCITDRGTSGQRNLLTPFDVRVTNIPAFCGNILIAGYAVVPFNDNCVEWPVGDSVVPAAVSLAGAKGTQWESDFRFFNPCREAMDVRIELRPEGTKNSGQDLADMEFTLNPGETRVFSSVLEAIPDLEGGEVSGSVKVESSSVSGCKVVVVSRTFNDTPVGTLGIFVPAMPERTGGQESLNFTGLIHTNEYRTNLRLINFSAANKWVALAILDESGNQLTPSRNVKVHGMSARQLSEVASWLGVAGDLPLFSLRVATSGAPIDGAATVIDNITGDSVLYVSSFLDENKAWVAGAAHISGARDAEWRTDLSLHNPTGNELSGELEYVVGANPDEGQSMDLPPLATGAARQWSDVVGTLLEGEESQGYLVVSGIDGGPSPQIAARTFTEDGSGGTYGLSLPTFGSRTLLTTGDSGFIVGVSNSEDPDVGFRTNIGLLNTDEKTWAFVLITKFEADGSPAFGNPIELSLPPGKMRQIPMSNMFGFNDQAQPVSLQIYVIGGRGVAAYATEIDNRTNDSIFIPAQRAYSGYP